MTMYMHKETGSVDDADGWMESYEAEELAELCLTKEEAFRDDVGVTLFEVKDDRHEVDDDPADDDIWSRLTEAMK